MPNEHVNVVAVMRSQESGSALRELCSGMNGTKVTVHVSSLADVTADKKIVNGHDMLLLDLDPGDSAAPQHLRRILKEDFASTPVVVTAPDVGIDDIRAIMRLGVVDFLPQPIRQTDLLIALDHVVRRRMEVQTPRGPRGKVISFLKGGGGVGATSLAVQIGCIASQSGQDDRSKACLLDFDLQFGAAGLYLDLVKPTGLLDLIESPERLDASLLSSAITHNERGPDVLLAPREVIPLDALSPDFVAACLGNARELYNHVLVDLPPAWTSWTFSALEASDLIIIVTQLTVGGIGQTLRQLDTLRAHDLTDAPVKIVLNKCDKRRRFASSAHFKDAEKAIGRKFDYLIPNDYALVSEAINQGVPIWQIKRRSKVEKAIRQMVEGIQVTLDQTGARIEASRAV